MQVLINIDVDDLDKAIAFYQAALGLQLSRRLFDDEVAEMLGASSRIYLLKNAAGTAVSAGREVARLYERHWTPVHLDFVVDDVHVALRRATLAGARQETPLQSFPWGWLVTLSDPFGNGFCLVQFLGAPYEGQKSSAST